VLSPTHKDVTPRLPRRPLATFWDLDPADLSEEIQALLPEMARAKTVLIEAMIKGDASADLRSRLHQALLMQLERTHLCLLAIDRP
jgi:hypothetical protein